MTKIILIAAALLTGLWTGFLLYGALRMIDLGLI
jgi:hypothetical protein